MVNIAIFASGSGTNAENLMKCFQNSQINVKRIFCNKPDAGVIQRAEKFHVPVTVFTIIGSVERFLKTIEVPEVICKDATPTIGITVPAVVTHPEAI